MAFEFLSRAAKIAWYVLSVATKTAWDVLSYIHKVQMRRLGIHAQKFQGCELELHTYIPLAPHCSLLGPTTSPFLSTLSQLIWGTFSMQ